jgi:flagellar basal body rod protein FlgC
MNRLDEIKKKQEHEKNHPDSDYFVTYSDVDWLIEQAELLEKERSFYDGAIQEDRETITRLLEKIERYEGVR